MANFLTGEILKRLNERCAEISDHLARGVPSDYPSYREMVGKYRGLREAIEDVKEIENRYDKDEDND